jgi:hypothetical protein
MSTLQRNDARVVRVSSAQRATLQHQTLEVLELEHHRFESYAGQTAVEQMMAARIFRNAFDVLDALAWQTPAGTGAVDVALTADHVAQLEARRTDLAMAIVDRLDARDELPSPSAIASMHADNLADRATLHDLAAIVTAYHHAARP